VAEIGGAALSSFDPVEVTGAGHVYRLPSHDASSVKELATRALRRKKKPVLLKALDDVTFSVERGEVLAVIGANGAGKSTLMKLLARVLPPTSGRVVVRGKVSPMIELGAGFNPEQTARENIVLYGTLLGRSPQEMRRRCDAIVEWAELVDYLDVPVRAFSSGMVARLAFSVATDVHPDVLLIDEILAVGDDSFQRRSLERMSELIGGGAAVVLVTHSMADVLARSHRAMLLVHGKVRSMGDPELVVKEYMGTIDAGL
jgi:ABC-type polysaccharide/polyol phosphate transport system ATPase subunit